MGRAGANPPFFMRTAGGKKKPPLPGQGGWVAGTAATAAARDFPKAWSTRWAPDNVARATTEPAPSEKL